MGRHHEVHFLCSILNCASWTSSVLSVSYSEPSRYPNTSFRGLEAVLRDLYLTFSSLVLSSLGKIVSSTGLLCSSNPMRALGPIAEDDGRIGEFSRILECFDAEYGYALPRNSKMLQNESFWWFSGRVGVCHGAMAIGYEYVLESTSY